MTQSTYTQNTTENVEIDEPTLTMVNALRALGFTALFLQAVAVLFFVTVQPPVIA